MTYPGLVLLADLPTDTLREEIARRERLHATRLCPKAVSDAYLQFSDSTGGNLKDFHTEHPRSVLQDWVQSLPLREQGTLLTGIRGCDLTPKFPLDSPERQLVAALRFVVMNAFDPREVDSEPGCFMISRPPTFKWSAFGHYPQHWVSHMLHCCEVVGYRHPSADIAQTWLNIYLSGCRSFHLKPETMDEMIYRLGEDRIASGEVVS